MKAKFIRNVAKKINHTTPVHIISKLTGQGGVELPIRWDSMKMKTKKCKGEVIKENAKTVWVQTRDSITNEMVTIKRHKVKHAVTV